MKILVDPGHGRYGNPYPPRKGYYEGTQMWKLSNYLIPELERYGFDVITTRQKVTDDPSVSDRGKMAVGCDLVVSLHSNAPASASDTKPTGSVIYRTIETPEIKPLCDKIGQKISEIMGHHYRGTMTKESGSRPGKNYNGVLRNAISVGCKAGMLIEHGFHTNLSDSAFLIVDSNLEKLAIAEAKEIADYYGIGGVKVVLRKGDKNDNVKQLQIDLLALGYTFEGYGADGSYGGATERTVSKFQKDNNLKVDGIAGAATQAKIAELLKIKDNNREADLLNRIELLEKRLKQAKDFANKIMGV